MDTLNKDYFIQTDHASNVNFKLQYSAPNNTYYMPDSILLVTDSSKDTIWSNVDSKYILDQIESKLENFGYKRITDPNLKSKVNLGVMVTYLRDLRAIDYYEQYWWGGKYTHWNAENWGWLPWYHPYNINYKYATGTIVIEMVDPSYNVRKPKTSTVVWIFYGRGILSPYFLKNFEYINNAIDLAFLQSAYLNLN